MVKLMLRGMCLILAWCWAYGICPGICPSEFITETGVLDSKRQSPRCVRTLAKIENAAYLYFNLCKMLSDKRS